MAFVDRSNVNGADNYAVARKAGLRHAYFKVSEGTTFVDLGFQSRKAEAHRAGVVVGGYHFGGHDNPVAEADHFLAHIGRVLPGDLKPVLDLEAGQSVAWAEAFVSHVRARLGFYPVLYGSTSFIGPMRAASAILRKCPYWRAEYSVNDGRMHPLVGGRQGAVLHQFTSVGRMAGISGNTDLNRYVANPASLFVPHPTHRKPRRLAHKAWVWARWYTGTGEFKGHRQVRKLRPNVPARVPAAWWKNVRWIVRNVLAKR